ncbi:MAG TPA: beta-ketoacyl synthase N-terminal-like domain-containing protein [Gemmataceae bacterium]|nr:beta-ketoacyl synthase N-terminal-like domain-containing protein [Gemmataceae bacterium]
MTTDKDVAVVGMGCVFPKAANVKQFWSNLANGVDAIDSPPPGRWSNCRNFELAPDHEAFIACNRGGFLPTDLPFDPLPFGVLPNLVRHGDPDQFLTLHVIDAALRDAGIAEDSPLRKRTDVIVGRGGYPTGKLIELTMRAELYDAVLELLERHSPEWMEERRGQLETYLRSTLTPPEVDNVSTAIPNITASRAANRLNLRGTAYVVDAACASSLLAVEQAVWRLRNRQCDVAIAAGVFLDLNMTFLHVFARLGAISPSGAIRPFDRRADGLLPGEGGGAVALKRLEDARRDGDLVYAILKGVGSASDGREVDVLAPSSAGQVQALETAYADAGLDRDTIGYLELHGTGTIVGDLTELATVKTFFGAVPEPATARAMGSVKSMIGHCMPAAGIAAFIKTALALSNKVLPPSLHCEEPRPELRDAPFFMNTRTRPWVHNPATGPRRAGINTFGFGGINAHVILEEVADSSKRMANGRRQPAGESLYQPADASRSPFSNDTKPRPIEPGIRRTSELLAFAAATEDELDEQIRQVERFLDRDETSPTLGDVALSLARRLDRRHPCKLALVCDNLTHLRKLTHCWLNRSRPGLDTTLPEEIYYSAHADVHEGKIAFLFPGMGFPGLIGNYPDHLMELCLHYPEVRAEFDLFEDRDRHPEDNVPTSSIFAPPASLPEEYRQKLKSRLAPPKTDDFTEKPLVPRERYLAAMGVTLSNWASWLLLRKFHIPVDMISGQSQGEMAALCAAGAADFNAVAPGFWKVLNVDARDAAGRQLCFAWATEEQVRPLLDDNSGTYIAIHMTPQSIILGGDRDGLRRIADKLREQEILVQPLPYPAIHTPCLSHLRQELLDAFRDEQAEFGKPLIDFYSSITSAKYPDDEVGIRETLLMNLDRPLRVWQTVRKMYEDGARIFVQVGGGHLAAHLKALLAEDAEALTVALDVDTRNPLTQLHHLCATLFHAGVPLDLAPLFEHRTLRELDLATPQPAPTPARTGVSLRIDWSPLNHENARRHQPAAEFVGWAEGREAHHVPLVDLAALGPPYELPAEAIRMPVLGNIIHFTPDKELRIERKLDLAEDRYLAHHLFVHAPCKPAQDCLPVLPMTMSMEFVAEAAALLAPGLGLIGFEDVRALRWIGLRDRAADALVIDACLESFDADTGVRRVRGTILFEDQPSFSATVVLAEEYRQDVHFELADSSGEGPWPFPIEEVYGDRRMFHGSTFHTLAALHTLGNPGASGALKAMPRERLFASHPDPLLLTDPCLMDGIGQFVGLFAQLHGQFIMPTRVDRIEFYAPPPPPDSILPIRMEILSCDHDLRQCSFNVELEDGEGHVWARVCGWTDWLLRWQDRYLESCRDPYRNVMSEEIDLPHLPQGSVCMLVPRDFLAGVDLDWAARLYLHLHELPAYWEQNKEQRRQTVLSRAAVKDAVRVWWSRKYGTSLPHPAEFAIDHDTLGRPFLEPGDDAARPYISLAHTAAGAVAIASDVPVGIDLEEAGRDTRAILNDFATREEREQIDRLSADYPGEAFETRLWCAKEAASKALGTGLRGRPSDFEAIESDEEGEFLIHHAPTGERLAIRSIRVGPFVLAYGTRPGGTPVEAANKISQAVIETR